MEKKNKKKYLLITLGVIGTILLVVGITYAYWILTRQQEGTNVVNTACLSVDIESEADDITLDKAYPISDDDGKNLKPYKFTIHNKCDDNASYQINLESLSKRNGETLIAEENRLDEKYLKVKLNEEETDGKTMLLTGTKEEDTTSVKTTLENAYKAHKLLDGYLEPNSSKKYELRLWLDSTTTIDEDTMNKQFVSKISVTSTYLSEEEVNPTSELALSVCENTITATSTASAKMGNQIAKYEYKLDEENWKDGEEIQEFDNLDNKVHEIKLRVTDNKGNKSEEVSQSIEVNYTAQTVTIGEMQIPITTCKNNGLYETKHDDLEELEPEWNKTEYRYAGVNPNNYVSFNNEIWRIIGLVNVKNGESIEQRIKIVRQDGVGEQKNLGYYAWDKDEEYTNNWNNSTLKNMLNGIYYESSTGECFSGMYCGGSASKNTCDFNTGTELPKGLDDTARSMIDKEVTWNIGGWTTGEIITKQIYEKERGTSTGISNEYPSEWSKETDEGEKHNGIGLIYPSDYGYAVGGEVRNNCLTKNLSNYNRDNCYENDWLKPSNHLWTISPKFSYNDVAFSIRSYGNVYFYDFVRGVYEVEPVGYLTKTVTITSGEGTMEQPYQLQLNA